MDIRVSNGILYFSPKQMEEQIAFHGDKKEFRTEEEIREETRNAPVYSVVGYIGPNTLREWKGIRGGKKTYIVTTPCGYMVCRPWGTIVY